MVASVNTESVIIIWDNQHYRYLFPLGTYRNKHNKNGIVSIEKE
jgi:hypothetical protein